VGAYEITVLDLPGCHACGRTVQGAIDNAIEALACAAREARDAGEVMPPPSEWATFDVPAGVSVVWLPLCE
jgi:predicted RNase H-like HicB family nuclease